MLFAAGGERGDKDDGGVDGDNGPGYACIQGAADDNDDGQAYAAAASKRRAAVQAEWQQWTGMHPAAGRRPHLRQVQDDPRRGGGK